MQNKNKVNIVLKVFFVILLSFIFCQIVYATNELISIVIWTKDGTKVAYALADRPKVLFTDTTLVILSNGFEVDYSLENMAYIAYEEDEKLGISFLETDNTVIKLDGESLIFPALKANNTISIYSLNGTLIFTKKVRQNGDYAFPISMLNRGVYMISVDGLTYKIVKK